MIITLCASMKIISWNVNGIQSVLKKSIAEDQTSIIIKHKLFAPNNVLSEMIKKENPDILCLQETRCSEIDKCLPYLFGHIYTNASESKKGHSGTLICTKTLPLGVTYGFKPFNDTKELNDEGRMITLEYTNFYVVNVYAPNSQAGYARLDFRIFQWEVTMRAYLEYLNNKKPVILVGDLNCIPGHLDTYDESNDLPGNHNLEKLSFKKMLNETQMIDTFREIHKDKRKYSWHFPTLKINPNIGLRLDFAIIPKTWQSLINLTDILSYQGSDHLPIVLCLNMAIDAPPVAPKIKIKIKPKLKLKLKKVD